MNTINKYYVYRHIRLDTNRPFYVGKGSMRRAYNRYNRNKYWKNIANKTEIKVEIILSNLTEEDAYKWEIIIIKLYKSYGYCEANISNGGDGSPGYICSESHKLKISLANKGRVFSEESKLKISKKLKNRIMTPEHRLKISKGNKGRIRSREEREKISIGGKGRVVSETTRLKISKSNLGRKNSENTLKKLRESRIVKIMCVETKIIYNSIIECSIEMKLDPHNISAVVNGRRKTCGGFTFIKINT